MARAITKNISNNFGYKPAPPQILASTKAIAADSRVILNNLGTHRQTPIQPMTTITLKLDSIVHLTDEQFYQLCQANRDVRFERTAKGELIVMPPAGGETLGKVRTLGSSHPRATPEISTFSS